MSNEIANTILWQLGGITLSMLGAKDEVALPDGVQFRIRGSKKGNKLVIKLDPDDTYVVEFWKIRGINFTLVEKASGVYVDSLHKVIESMTGLYTRL